jgi:hypothetical protein bacD2_24866
MPISPQEKKYLKNKHKGGNNNSKGNIYESFYTTYCIALFMNSHITQLDSVHFTSQLEECFVDDLLIEESNTASSDISSNKGCEKFIMANKTAAI